MENWRLHFQIALCAFHCSGVQKDLRGKKCTSNEHNHPIKMPDCLEQNCTQSLWVHDQPMKKTIEVQWEQSKEEKKKAKSHDIPSSQRLVIASPYWQHLLITICSVVGWWLFMQKLTHHWHVLKKTWTRLMAEKNVSIMSHIVLIFPSRLTQSTTKIIHVLEKSHTNHIIVPNVKDIQERETEEYNTTLINSPLKLTTEMLFSTLIWIVQAYMIFFLLIIYSLLLWHNMENNQWWNDVFIFQCQRCFILLTPPSANTIFI